MNKVFLLLIAALCSVVCVACGDDSSSASDELDLTGKKPQVCEVDVPEYDVVQVKIVVDDLTMDETTVFQGDSAYVSTKYFGLTEAQFDNECSEARKYENVIECNDFLIKSVRDAEDMIYWMYAEVYRTICDSLLNGSMTFEDVGGM